MSLSNGTAVVGAGSVVSEGGRRPVVVRSVHDSPGSSASSVASSSSSSSSSSPSSTSALSLDDLPLVLSILLEVEARQRSLPAPSRTAGAEAQAWVLKITEALDDALDDDDVDDEDDREEPVRRLADALAFQLQAADGEWVSSLDMILKLEPRSSLAITSHPLLALAVERLWVRGRSSAQPDEEDEPLPMLARYLRYLDSLCTPSRLHTVVLLSRLVHLALTLSLLIYPGGFVPVDVITRAPKARLNWREVLWAVWTAGTIVEIVARRFKCSLVLPAVALLLAILRSSLAYSTLTLAIPGLVFALLSSLAPSFAHLTPLRTTYLPFASYTTLLLRRTAKPLVLLTPPLLALFALVTWSFNGDPWRLGFALVFPETGAGPFPEPIPTPEPVEPGVAPFGVRLWLAITFTLLLLASVLVGCSRLMPARQSSRAAEDGWTAEWGDEAASSARRARVQAVADFLVDPARFASPRAPADDRRPSAPALLEAQPLAMQPDLGALAPYRPLPVPSPLNLVLLPLAGAQAAARLAGRHDLRVEQDAVRARVDGWVWRFTAVVLLLDLWDLLRRFGKDGWARVSAWRNSPVRLA